MNRKFILGLAALCLTLGITGCNSSDDSVTTDVYYSAMVRAFSFKAKASVMQSLDSVFFSIDQQSMTIFNADSLPMGADITSLVPDVTTAGASLVEFHVPTATGRDTVYNYLENAEDSIDFSSDAVRLRIVSLDGSATSVYKIKVNVHRVKADTMVWSRMERANVPTSLPAVKEQHTTSAASKFFTLTRYQQQYCIAAATNPAGDWEFRTPAFSFTPDVNSFTATDSALFILDNAGNLYTSSDQGASWSATGQRMTYVYGAYGDRLLGSLLDGGKWYHVSFPAAAPTPMSSDFPVRNTSQMISYEFQMSTSPQLMMVGGRLADGSLSRAAWGYDGNTWARISQKGLKYGVENMTIFPYFMLKRRASGSLILNKESVIMAMNGSTADGKLNDTIFISRDFGVNWAIADSAFQVTRTFPARTLAQAFVFDQPTNANGPVMKSLPWAPVSVAPLDGGIQTLATKPITEWNVPYIYMFGGVNAEGQTLNTLYRGVINQLRFKPLQ